MVFSLEGITMVGILQNKINDKLNDKIWAYTEHVLDSPTTTEYEA